MKKGHLRMGRSRVIPFTNKQKARKFMVKAKRQGLHGIVYKHGNIYLVVERKKRGLF